MSGLRFAQGVRFGHHILYILKNKRLRRSLGAILAVTGGLLMWLAPEARVGILLFSTGIVLELIGIWLEHERRR